VLGAIRCLAAEGIRSYCVTGVEPYIAYSRYYHKLSGAREALRDPAELPHFLQGLSLSRAVLLPCADDWVLAVAKLPPELSRRFPSSAPSLGVLEQFLDKAKLERLLDRFEVQRPQTRPLSGHETLREVDWDSGTSWFLKPVDSQSFRRCFGVKAFRVASLADAEARWDEIHAAGLELVLQEYVAGPASNHFFVDGFVDREGEIRALFARQRLRIHPPDFGDSSALVSVPLEEVAPAVSACRRLVSGVGFRGIFSVEFKRDAKDGAFKLIEMNTRAWANVAFARSCGINTPLMAYRDALGLAVESVREYAIGRRFCFFPADFSACRRLHRSGQIGLTQWLLSWINAEASVFRWSDPLPGVRQALQLGASAMKKLFA